jgi:hypothetical protein
MKNPSRILTITAAFLLSVFCFLLCLQAQQFTPVTTPVTTIPPVVWRGTNAQVIARQLLAVTNANGTLVLPPGLLTNRVSTLLIRFESGASGLQTIRATFR